MKKNKNIFKDIVIGVIVLIVFIIIVSNGSKPTYSSPINYNMLRFSNIFSYREKINLDDLEPHLSIKLVDYGYDIFTAKNGGYRYGPSIMRYDDGTMDTWYVSNGNSSTEWDYIKYRHFDGDEWTEEETVLSPTKKSKDHYSTCDPGAIYFDGYYYIGYTSTENATGGGIENCGYVARSINPNGPFEKWDGEGWSNNPEPIIVYDENDGAWGAGEITFVIVKEKLFCYYTWISKQAYSTRLAIANLEENWPATLKFKGTAIERQGNQGSVDIVYVDEYEKFLALCVEDNFGKDSCVGVYESDDGLTYKQVDRVNGINMFAHNLGVSKSPAGHISMNDDLLVGYGYSKGNKSTWGRWALKFQKARIKVLKK